MALINKVNNVNSSYYVKFDEELFNDIKVKKIIRNFESLSSPGKHDGDLLTKEILHLSQNSFMY